MTEIAFHFNAPDKLAYACRLLRKAVAQGAQVTVTAQMSDLRKLDGLLWTFSQQDFVSHVLWPASVDMLEASAVVLCENPAESPQTRVLLNLGLNMPQGFERFERVIDVVSLDEADRQGARQRWKAFTGMGYTITRHDLNLKETA